MEDGFETDTPNGCISSLLSLTNLSPISHQNTCIMLQLRQLFDSLRPNLVEISIATVVCTAAIASVYASASTIGVNSFVGYTLGCISAWLLLGTVVWSLTKLLDYAVQLGLASFLRSHIKR